MINSIGIIILIAGFLLPYMTDIRMPSTAFFWLGGLLSLKKGIIIRNRARRAQWAQIGILLNIALVIGMFAADFLIGSGSMTRFAHWLFMVFYWLSSPVTAVGQKIFPYPETYHPDGAVSFQISYSRTVITAFLNVAIFAMLFSLIGMFWQKGNRQERQQKTATKDAG